jgi:hypothetical protein
MYFLKFAYTDFLIATLANPWRTLGSHPFMDEGAKHRGRAPSCLSSFSARGRDLCVTNDVRASPKTAVLDAMG